MIVRKLRNVGIIAHINAGKTTTTERILYHAGQTQSVGDVDKGNTITDYLIQERDRGITITSAVVSYDWQKHHVNLIDTPGHVDFTIEVERSLSVLDGAVTILDSSAGVEAQTVTVWNQASKYQLPNLIYLNKYDKPQANYKFCIKHLRACLSINPILVQVPIKTTKSPLSLFDVINKRHLRWIKPESDLGSEFASEILDSTKLDKCYIDQVEEQRELLVNTLSDLDNELANHVIECDKIADVSGELLQQALKRATLDCKISPVLIGSSFKYIGVQQLMDSINNYLPNPDERENQIRSALKVADNDPLQARASRRNCAFIFKIMHNKRLGALNFVKVCSGQLSKLQRLSNLESGSSEQIKRVYRPFADDFVELTSPASKNSIVVVTGLSESRTGDILVDAGLQFEDIQVHDDANDKSDDCKHQGAATKCRLSPGDSMPFKLLCEDSDSTTATIVVPQIKPMEPVYYCSIESKNAAQQLKLEHALACLAREDPSLSFESDRFGITTIRGMGKLHLEVVRDRIESEYNIEPLLGPLQISYRETIDGSVEEQLEVSRLIKGANNVVSIALRLASKPNIGTWTGKLLRLDRSDQTETNLDKLPKHHRKAIELGLMSALQSGPRAGYQVIDCEITLLDFVSSRRCGLPIISSAASQCLTSAMLRCAPKLLEPIMALEVVLPKDFTGQIMTDIAHRRGLVQSTEAKLDNLMMVVRALCPLSTLEDYCEYLRVATSGRASFSLELHSYQPF